MGKLREEINGLKKKLLSLLKMFSGKKFQKLNRTFASYKEKFQKFRKPG